jgi:hypothetical protein
VAAGGTMKPFVPAAPLLAGMFGGALVAFALAMILAANGGLGSSHTTVTVQQTPIVLSGRSAVRGASNLAAAVYAHAATGVVFVRGRGGRAAIGERIPQG